MVVAAGSWSELRAVAATDLQACTEFSCCVRARRFGAVDIQRQVRTGKAFRRTLLEHDHRFLGAFDEAGNLAAVAYHEPAPHEQVGVMARYLRFIALADARQRRGEGSRLLHATHDAICAEYRGTEAVLVRVHPQHATSISLIDQNAYVRVPQDSGADPLFIRALCSDT